ncbi:MAG: hypothetical protein IKO91_08910 [Oscillospiraceae bacterium]|nr:hypothetical protein [Oscillospiraceae bacterium]
MKRNTNLTLKIACYLVFAALLVWLGIYTYQAMNDPYRTVPVTTYVDRETAPVRGIVAREEEVILSTYTAVNLKLQEGSRVAKGGTVAEAFRSEEALLRAVRLSDLEAEAAELTTLLTDSAMENARQTDAEIQSGIRRLRQQVSSRSFAEAESLSQLLETQVFAVFSSQSDIRERLQEVNGEIGDLRRHSSESADILTAPVPGLFSTGTDGWESLGYEELQGITPGALESLLGQRRQPSEQALGKLVSGVKWYFAALIGEEDADVLYGRREVRLRFGRYYGEELNMQVESLSALENGRRVILLSCSEALSDVKDMRLQEGELLLSEISGFRIPRRGLHVDEDGYPCVYVQTALMAEKKRVEVLRDYGDYYLVGSETLHAGDEIIVSAKKLYDGKVVG